MLGQPSLREAAQRLRQAIQADLAADRAVAELEAWTDATIRVNGVRNRS